MIGRKKLKKLLLWALKTAVGSSISIYIAQKLNLQYAISAGSIALLTLVTTRWETFKLSLYRVVTFVMTAAIAWIVFTHLDSVWIAYGIYIFLIAVICDILGWRATISVNAVIGTHFLSTHDFGPDFIVNEFLLVLIGITCAIILNLFHDNRGDKKELVKNMRYVENRLQTILMELASYLHNETMTVSVWNDICELEAQIHEFISDAYEHQENTFHSHPKYYIDYFEMRMNQCGILHNLHYEAKKIRTMPKQANVIAEYILYMKDYVIEINNPVEQIEKLKGIISDIENDEPPTTREEFESRAMLYHIMMDIEEFLVYKRRFVEEMTSHQLERHWKID